MHTYIYICVHLEIYLYKYISIYLLTYFSSCIVPPSFIQKRWIPKQKIHPFFDLKDLQPSLRSGFPCFDPNPANAAAPCEGRCRSVGTWDVSSPGGRTRRKGSRLKAGRDLSLFFWGPGIGVNISNLFETTT